MLIKAIPKKLLPHSVVYRPFTGNDRNGAVWGKEITLSNVAVEYKTRYAVKSNAQTVDYKAVVYYDCRNSSPKGIKFKEKDIIIHNGNEMTVTSVLIPNAHGDTPHHYELGCV